MIRETVAIIEDSCGVTLHLFTEDKMPVESEIYGSIVLGIEVESRGTNINVPELDHLIQSLIYFRTKIDAPFKLNTNIHVPHNEFYE